MCFAKVFGWVSTGTTATSTPTRSRVSEIHLRWHYTNRTGNPWGSPRMGDRLTKSHYVLYFPRLGNQRTSRSLQARYRFVLEGVFMLVIISDCDFCWFACMNRSGFLGFYGLFCPSESLCKMGGSVCKITRVCMFYRRWGWANPFCGSSLLTTAVSFCRLFLTVECRLADHVPAPMVLFQNIMSN